MIPRYEFPLISKLWTDEHKFKTFLKVELALLEALEAKGLVPQGTAMAFSKVRIDLKRIEEIESEVGHDVVAFCTSISEQVEKGFSKFFHYGVTSSDIIDTALSLQIRDSLEIVQTTLDQLLEALEDLCQRSSDILCMGRSHGINAEPMILSQKWLGHLEEFKRRKKRFQDIDCDLSGQCSGAVGNYTILTPEVEEYVMASLGLKVEALSTQVIPRDHHASLAMEIGLLGCALERLSIELRHLQHSDIHEASEGRSLNQKGSSTMPHKKNPISAENLSGLSRILRSYTQVAMDNTLLWHERDISHSSAERLYLPDAFGLSCYALKRMAGTLKGLNLHTENIESKVALTDTALSSFFLHHLIVTTQEDRETLYKWVQEASFKAIENKGLLRNELESILRENLNQEVKLPETRIKDLKTLYKSRLSEKRGK